MSGEPVPATVRFSNGGGDPTVPDYAPDVRGLAVSFQLPDGSRTDISSQTLPRYPFRDQEGFLAAMKISKPSLSALAALPGFLLRHRTRARGPPARRTGSWPSAASFAARSYYAFHAYKWIDADGGERYVRYTWRPTVDEPEPSREEAKRRGADYLFDDLAAAARARAGADAPRAADRRRRRRPRRPVGRVARGPRAGRRRDARGHGDRRGRRRRDRLRPDPGHRRDRALSRPGAPLPPDRLRPLRTARAPSG